MGITGYARRTVKPPLVLVPSEESEGRVISTEEICDRLGTSGIADLSHPLAILEFIKEVGGDDR